MTLIYPVSFRTETDCDLPGGVEVGPKATCIDVQRLKDYNTRALPQRDIRRISPGMRTRRPTNRIPIIVLGAIAALAIIGRMLTPSQGPLPGPIGNVPTWKSLRAEGTMGPWAVNPTGTMWAGAWNIVERNGETYSAVWVVDFEKRTSVHSRLWPGSSVTELNWSAENAVVVKSAGTKPGMARMDPAKQEDVLKPEPVDPDGKRRGYRIEVGEDKTYTFLTDAGTSVRAFEAKSIPGKIEGAWASPAGILVLCRDADTFTRHQWSAATGKLSLITKEGFGVDVKADWPEVPQEMFFVTYRGGFRVSPIDGSVKQIFSYKDLPADDEHWRGNVEDGRLYPRKDGGYTSVSFSAGTIDIRVMDEKGRVKRDLLARS